MTDAKYHQGHRRVSRTTRPYIGGPDRNGKQYWPIRIARDDRATDFRDHKRDSRVDKVSLKSGNEDALPSGKRRRYSDSYGSYDL